MKRLIAIAMCCMMLMGCAAAPQTATPTPGNTPTAAPTSTAPAPDDAGASSADFRQVKWGMSKDEVAATEQSKPIHDEKNLLVYENQTVLGLDALVSYMFDEYGLCTEAYCLFDVNQEDAEALVRDYRKLKAELFRAYGEPTYDHTAEDSDDIPSVVASGEESLTAEFETENTVVTLMLWQDEDMDMIKLDLSFEAKGL
jgi:hypothetical protein